MIRLIAAAGFALAVATSAQAITPAPIPQPDGMITQVRLGCGPGRTRVAGVCEMRRVRTPPRLLDQDLDPLSARPPTHTENKLGHLQIQIRTERSE